MKIFSSVILGILVLLAISSGITKIMLMQQDVEFFGNYGFTNSILVTYGATQLVGGILLALRQTRIIGAIVVAITLLVSLVVLLMSGNIPVAIVTVICVAFLMLVIKQSLNSMNVETGANNT